MPCRQHLWKRLSGDCCWNKEVVLDWDYNLLQGRSCVSLCNVRNKSNWIYFQGLRWMKCTDCDAIALSISDWALYQGHCSLISLLLWARRICLGQLQRRFRGLTLNNTNDTSCFAWWIPLDWQYVQHSNSGLRWIIQMIRLVLRDGYVLISNTFNTQIRNI